MELIIESRNLAIKHLDLFDENIQIVVLGVEFDNLTCFGMKCLLYCEFIVLFSFS
jgi:hypothetical protein